MNYQQTWDHRTHYEAFEHHYAVQLLHELVAHLETINPADFNQEEYWSALRTGECGCIAAHSYWLEHGRASGKGGADLDDAPAYRAVSQLITHHDLSHNWSTYIFEIEEEGREIFPLIPYYGATPEGGAARIRRFLDEIGELDVRLDDNNLEDLV